MHAQLEDSKVFFISHVCPPMLKQRHFVAVKPSAPANYELLMLLGRASSVEKAATIEVYIVSRYNIK
jgi:hypothetical protein